MIYAHKDLLYKLRELEKRIGKHDRSIQDIFNVIHQLIVEPKAPKRKIGFNGD